MIDQKGNFMPNGMTPWQYLNSIIDIDKFTSYLNSQEVDSAYRYLRNIYGYA